MWLTSVSDKIVFGEIEYDFSELSSPTPYVHTHLAHPPTCGSVCVSPVQWIKDTVHACGGNRVLETTLQCFHIVSVYVYIYIYIAQRKTPAKLQCKFPFSWADVMYSHQWYLVPQDVKSCHDIVQGLLFCKQS